MYISLSFLNCLMLYAKTAITKPRFVDLYTLQHVWGSSGRSFYYFPRSKKKSYQAPEYFQSTFYATILNAFLKPEQRFVTIAVERGTRILNRSKSFFPAIAF